MWTADANGATWASLGRDLGGHPAAGTPQVPTSMKGTMNIPVESTVETSAGRMRYWEAGSGHPMILLHGSGPGATGLGNFAANIPALAARFHVFAVDAPGWGGSDPVAFRDSDHMSAHVAFMDALGIERAALVGNSMGGVTATLLAARHPERVSHLIPMGSASLPYGRLFSAAGPTEGIKALFAAYADPTASSMRQLCDVMMFDASPDRLDELAELRLAAALANPVHLANFLEGIPQGGPISEWFTVDDLRGITAPTLLIHGRDDRVVPYEHSLELLAIIPDSRLVLLNRCGHWAMVEHAAEFDRLVVDFVSATV